MTTRFLSTGLAFALIVVIVLVTGSAHAQTNYTGPAGGDINSGANWDNGLPTNTGLNDGTVATGATNLTGSPQNKNIIFNGTSGYNAGNFGGGNANGYDITFNGTGNSNFSGNGLFLAWDGGAGNKSDMHWNSSGQLDTTRFFVGRFGEGDFVQSAGTVNQNNGGGFDFILGEFAVAPNATGDGWHTYTLNNGTLNAAGELAIRDGIFDQNGGTANFNNAAGIVFNEGNTDGFYNLAAGVITTQNITGFDNNDAFNFTAGSTGILEVLTVNQDQTALENLINSGRITLGGNPAVPGDFVFGTNGSFTTLQLPAVIEPPDTVGVPEPSSIAIWALIGLVLCGFGFYRGRRKGLKA